MQYRTFEFDIAAFRALDLEINWEEVARNVCETIIAAGRRDEHDDAIVEASLNKIGQSLTVEVMIVAVEQKAGDLEHEARVIIARAPMSAIRQKVI